MLGSAVGLVSKPDDFVGEVLAGSAVTAAHCVALRPDLREDTVDRVVAQIVVQLDPLLSLEASFARHMETNPFSNWGSVEMANDAMQNAVDKLYAKLDLQLVPALREMGDVGLLAVAAPAECGIT